MPLYEYQCDACRHRFEVIQKFSDPRVEKCPSCGGTVQKLQSAPAIQFKGAGFYITDYAKKEYTEATKADSGSPAAAAGGKEGGKEGSKEGGKEGSTDKTDKSVTPAKSSSASDSAPSSSSTTSKDSSSTKESSDR